MTNLTFRRIAVLNRGEAASRFLRGLREYDLERGTHTEAAVFYTDPDARSPWLQRVAVAIPLGAALQPDADGRMRSAYLDTPRIVALLLEHKCDAVWPGWGFVSEDADFVSQLDAAGIVFLGPPASAMLALGDKRAAKELAIQAGVPLARWCNVTAEDDATSLAAKAAIVGFPLMVKASAGGGGRGIRKVMAPDELVGAVAGVADEVARVFGAGTVLLEQCITGARHVEVQLVVGADGRATALGVRDCSIQRRHQKVIEESPCPVLTAAQADVLLQASAKMAELAGYRGVGTAEFLWHPHSETAAFLEVNARLQVEHTITELTSGVDLVHAQIDIARGLAWRRPDQAPGGCAVEVRLCAEDPERGCAPAPGHVRLLRFAGGPGIRVDAGIEEGMVIAPEFDSMIAKVMAWAPTRPLALARLQRALIELQIAIEDGAHNKGMLITLLQHPEVISGRADTTWMDRAMLTGELRGPVLTLQALLAAAVWLQDEKTLNDVEHFFAAAQTGMPRDLPKPEGRAIELKMQGNRHALVVHQTGPNRFAVLLAEQLYDVALDRQSKHVATLSLNGTQHAVVVVPAGAGLRLEVDGVLHTVETAAGGLVRAPAPALVVRLEVQPGDIVQVGQRLCVLEAMKLEMPLLAEQAGRVGAVFCRAHQQVTAGQALMEIETEERDDENAPQGPQLPLPTARAIEQMTGGGVIRPEMLDQLDPLQAKIVIEDFVVAVRGLLLGYDVPPQFEALLRGLMRIELDFTRLQHPDRWLPVVSLLEDFAALEALFGRDPLDEIGTLSMTPEFAFHDLCRRIGVGEAKVDPAMQQAVARALQRFGIAQLAALPRVREALWRMALAHTHDALRHRCASVLLRAVLGMHGAAVVLPTNLRETLDIVARFASANHPAVADNARQALVALDLAPRWLARRAIAKTFADSALQQLASGDPAKQRQTVADLVAAPHALIDMLIGHAGPYSAASAVAEVALRRLYLGLNVDVLAPFASTVAGSVAACLDTDPAGGLDADIDAVVALLCLPTDAERAIAALQMPTNPHVNLRCAIELLLYGELPASHTATELLTLAHKIQDPTVVRLTVTHAPVGGGLQHHTLTEQDGQWSIDQTLLGLHPAAALRLELSRYQDFELERLPAPEPLVALRARARSNADDERVLILCEVRDVPEQANVPGDAHLLPFELAFLEACRLLREEQVRRDPRKRLHTNRIVMYVRPILRLKPSDMLRIGHRFMPHTRGLGLEKVVISARVPAGKNGDVRRTVFVISSPGRHRMEVREQAPSHENVRPLDDAGLRRVQARRLGATCTEDLIRLLEGTGGTDVAPHPDLRRGKFLEHDLDASQTRLVPIARSSGQNAAGVVVGVIKHQTQKHPEGMERVLIASDPTKAMGALGEPECRRILAAFDLAQARGVPVEWVPVSSGARISMDSGTENLDWTARVLRRIVEFTRDGGVVHVLVAGTCVGAQSYWNAMATMLMHTKGILVMTPDAAMVLTGKRALEISGSIAAEDERGIGGFDRVMGPNGQAQFLARDLGAAYAILFEHYRFTWCRRGEAGPRLFETNDADIRSILDFPYKAEAGGFTSVGEIFDEARNPGRKRPFAIREVMAAVIDSDGGKLERWPWMRDAETAVVWDAHIGGIATCVLGFESQPQARRGAIPLDGPDTFTGGTLFPQSSKKIARGLRAASGNRPVVVLANLSGFDGSPESMRKLQLEFGAEIGRAVVEFDGPIVFVVVGRYHGGAYVVFSKALNPRLQALALEGSFASVIGGAPAAAVVFPREVKRRTEADSRVIAARKALEDAPAAKRPRLREKLETVLTDVTMDKQADVAREFDAVHSVDRAVRVGSLDAVIAPSKLRPEIIQRLRHALQAGWAREARPPNLTQPTA